MDQFYDDVLLLMSKGTELAIFTLLYVVGIE